MSRRDGCGACGRVSSFFAGEDVGGTNSKCHGFTGGVRAGGAVLIPHPQIVLVLWDHYYVTNPLAVSNSTKLITDLVAGRFMNGLTQYGVHRGTLINTIVIDTNSNNPAPTSWDVSDGNDSKQVLAWIDNGTLMPKPQRTSQGLPPNVLYFIFMPVATQLTFGTNPDGTSNTNVCGWHSSGILGDSDNTPVFWALVRTDRAPRTSEQAFVSSFAFCVSHELAEALTDAQSPFGFAASNGCEIADICELNPFPYKGWSIEQYWSNWDASCINGDQPVSLTKFLKAISFDPVNGLRGLPMLAQYGNTISLDYIADRSFPIFEVTGGD